VKLKGRRSCRRDAKRRAFIADRLLGALRGKRREGGWKGEEREEGAFVFVNGRPRLLKSAPGDAFSCPFRGYCAAPLTTRPLFPLTRGSSSTTSKYRRTGNAVDWNAHLEIIFPIVHIQRRDFIETLSEDASRSSSSFLSSISS